MQLRVQEAAKPAGNGLGVNAPEFCTPSSKYTNIFTHTHTRAQDAGKEWQIRCMTS